MQEFATSLTNPKIESNALYWAAIALLCAPDEENTMTVIYEMLGSVARFSERLSHYRINFVPLNLIVMGICGAVFLFGATEARDAIVNGGKPAIRTVADVLNRKDMGRNFVTVQGELHPEAGFQQTHKDRYGTSERNGDAYVVLLDNKEDRAILVQRSENDFENSKPAVTQITGMLKPLDSDLSAKLSQEGAKIGNVYIDTEYMLIEGRQPGDAETWVGVTAFTGVLLVLFLITFCTKYVVFQRSGMGTPTVAAMPAGLPQQGIDLRVTGRFVLDASNARRFLNMPAGMATLENGELALFSNIDASSKFMGVTTQKRAGLWAILLQQNSLRKMELGRLYVGFKPRPAVRIHYREESATHADATAILSFANEAERELVLNDLNRFAGYTMARS